MLRKYSIFVLLQSLVLVTSLWYPGKSYLSECCDERWIPADIQGLESSLFTDVFGQHIMEDIVVNAFRGHFKQNVQPRKALALSFHGAPGVGKNYVSSIIVKSLFSLADKSSFVHYFSGAIHFQLKTQAAIHKMQLTDWVKGNVSLCERSVFIFDEVDDMQENILDGIKPYLDSHTSIGGIDFRKSVFIFLSNTGSKLIAEQMLTLWEKGMKRHELQLPDFEEALRKSVFNEKGGLMNSKLIRSHVIDYYVPFLPLEKTHVRQCIRNEFHSHQYVHDEGVNEILKLVTFAPDDLQLYSKSGCRSISQKVIQFISKTKKKWKSNVNKKSNGV